MLMHRVISTYGRLIPPPNSDLQEDDAIEDAVVPIQDQIENLRIKIALKERYNRVLTEEIEANRQGTSSILKDLYDETRELRYRLLVALTSEFAAVQHALRAHRIIQLALTRRDTSHAIIWLDDKLFDTIKNLNRHLYDLKLKRRSLEEAEALVLMLEKWPRPGSLPWELDAIAKFTDIENTIEDVRIKGSTMAVLHTKYDEIKFILREEQGKYNPLLVKEEARLRDLKAEMKNLQRMLTEAIYFRDEALQNLTLTEREATENRKERRRIMMKTKKLVTNALAIQQGNDQSGGAGGSRKSGDGGGGRGKASQSLLTFDFSKGGDDVVVLTKFEKMLLTKREQMEDYQLRAHRLVDAMRVSDLTFIPERLKVVTELGQHLETEQVTKDNWRNTLLKQRDQLNLLFCHFRYTGELREDEFLKTKAEQEETLESVRQDIARIQGQRYMYGDITADLQLSVLSVLQRFEEGRRRGPGRIPKRELREHLKHVGTKMTKLVKAIALYEDLFQDKESDKNYGGFVKTAPIPPRLIRVDLEAAVDEDYEDDDLPDMKVPNREEIKMKSAKFIQQALLKRGLK